MARETAEAKMMRDAEAIERARVWAEAEAKEKVKIAMITAEDGGRDNAKVAERARVWDKAEAK